MRSWMFTVLLAFLVMLAIFISGCVEQSDLNKDVDALKQEVKELRSKISSLEVKTSQMSSGQLINTSEEENSACNGDYEEAKSNFLHVRDQLKILQSKYLDGSKAHVLAEIALEKAEQDLKEAKDEDDVGNVTVEDLEDERDQREDELDDRKDKLDDSENEMNSLENLFEQIKAEFIFLSEKCKEDFEFEDDACIQEKNDAQASFDDIDSKIDSKKDEIESKENAIDDEDDEDDRKDLEDELDSLVHELDKLKSEQDVAEEGLSLISYRCNR
ncbi:MAG TPA: hypothetical protein VJJ75_03515 [Candidatus Nanoarchaeia archaeon]|nr:hypothetical protein [Candidatus Nanoarchaeia archaeon]